MLRYRRVKRKCTSTPDCFDRGLLELVGEILFSGSCTLQFIILPSGLCAKIILFYYYCIYYVLKRQETHTLLVDTCMATCISLIEYILAMSATLFRCQSNEIPCKP